MRKNVNKVQAGVAGMIHVEGNRIFEVRYRKVWVAQLIVILVISAIAFTIALLFNDWSFIGIIPIALPFSIFIIACIHTSRKSPPTLKGHATTFIDDAFGYKAKYNMVHTQLPAYLIDAKYMDDPIYLEAVQEFHAGRLNEIIEDSSPAWQKEFEDLNEQMRKRKTLPKIGAKPSINYAFRAQEMNRLNDILIPKE